MKKIAFFIIMSILTLTLIGCDKSDKKDDSDNVNVITVVYEVDGGGTILGDDVQTINKGEGASRVTAVANDGWIFIGWDDGYKNPTRIDEGLTEDTVFVAIFENDGSGDNDEGDVEDVPDDAPDMPETDNGGDPDEEE